MIEIVAQWPFMLLEWQGFISLFPQVVFHIVVFGWTPRSSQMSAFQEIRKKKWLCFQSDYDFLSPSKGFSKQVVQFSQPVHADVILQFKLKHKSTWIRSFKNDCSDILWGFRANEERSSGQNPSIINLALLLCFWLCLSVTESRPWQCDTSWNVDCFLWAVWER